MTIVIYYLRYALLGIATVTLSDTFARVVFAPIELPVGIIIAFLGAPFFCLLRGGNLMNAILEAQKYRYCY